MLRFQFIDISYWPGTSLQSTVSYNTFYIFLSALSSYTIYSRQILCWCGPDRKYRQSLLNLPTLNHVIAIPSNDRRDDQQKYNNYQHLLVSFSPKAKHFSDWKYFSIDNNSGWVWAARRLGSDKSNYSSNNVLTGQVTTLYNTSL